MNLRHFIVHDAYIKVCKYIEEHVQQEDLNDEEETLARKGFKETNIEKYNLQSVTVVIPSAHVLAWEKTLEEKCGEPMHDHSATKNGKSYSFKNSEFREMASFGNIILRPDLFIYGVTDSENDLQDLSVGVFFKHFFNNMMESCRLNYFSLFLTHP